jgi:hypothetical protein
MHRVPFIFWYVPARRRERSRDRGFGRTVHRPEERNLQWLGLGLMVLLAAMWLHGGTGRFAGATKQAEERGGQVGASAATVGAAAVEGGSRTRLPVRRARESRGVRQGSEEEEILGQIEDQLYQDSILRDGSGGGEMPASQGEDGMRSMEYQNPYQEGKAGGSEGDWYEPE